MPATRPFFCFIPLSNWIRGFDRYTQVFDKTKLPSSHFPDCFYVLGEDAPRSHVEGAFDKTSHLVERLGIPGDRVVRLDAMLPVEGDIAACPNVETGTGIGWRWPSPRLPISGQGFAQDGTDFLSAPHETITAHAFALPNPDLHAWDECAPRSFSVLPIAQACNANCAFCFSKASMSDAIVPGKLNLPQIGHWSGLAKRRGAQRAVITGGGEPTLLAPGVMRELIEVLAKDFSSILLITNGSRILGHGSQQRNALEMLGSWKSAGLTRLAISRHGTTQQTDAALMGLDVPSAQALEIVHRSGLPSRLICVIQRGGVDSAQGVHDYLARAAGHGVSQVCFKELYVSSLSENPWAPSRENKYCIQNQVPLSMLISALEGRGFALSHSLPWGSPVYVGVVEGVRMQVAAYTEPSVGWERTRGIVRSWNWMSNGECLASLEDPQSRLPDACASYARKAIASCLVS